jgi:hypothetical protein
MKEIKNINKLIYANIIELIFVVAFIFGSIPLWENLNNSISLKTASSFENISYTNLTVDNPSEYVLRPMSNKEASESLEPYKLYVVNDTLTEEEYTLYLKIEKTSSLDYNNLNISINDSVIPLNELEMKEDLEYYYFTLDNNSIVGNTIDYDVKIWLDENTGNEAQGKSLSLTFDIEKNTLIQL